jgi:hypothetical protein
MIAGSTILFKLGCSATCVNPDVGFARGLVHLAAVTRLLAWVAGLR